MAIETFEDNYYCVKCKKPHKLNFNKHFEFASSFPDCVKQKMVEKKEKYYAVRKFNHDQTHSGGGYCYNNKF